MSGKVIESASLLSLLNDVAVFLKELWRRVQKWEETREDRHHRRLAPIGATRQWAKDQALTKVSGHFSDPKDALYIYIEPVVRDKSMRSSVRVKAKTYIEGVKGATGLFGGWAKAKSGTELDS